MQNIIFKTAKPLLVTALVYGATAISQVLVDQVPTINSGVVFAQEQAAKKEETRKTPAMRNAFFERLSKAQEAMEAKDYVGAIQFLDAMKLRHDRRKFVLNGYEMANLYNTYAFVYYTQEKYAPAINAFEQVLKQEGIPLGLELSTQYYIAQLYLSQENYPEGVKALEKWFKIEANPQPSAYMLLAQAYYQIEDYDAALTSVEKGMSIAKATGKAPKEQWYMLMRALYFQKNNISKMAWVMEEMAKLWPKREYFVQLSSAYGQLDDENRQLAAHDAAYIGWGLDKESSMLNMGYLYMGNDLPYYGGRVIEDGINKGIIAKKSKNYSSLAQAYSLAQETKMAIPYLEKAAEIASDGQPWARLADIYFDTERYQDAVKAAETAFKKGGVKRPENTYILMGMAYFNLDKFKDAKREFKKAKKTKSTAKVAAQWIKYIDSEIKRRADLKSV